MSLTCLWNLDESGIVGPVERKSRFEMEMAAQEFFKHKVCVNNKDGYEIKLP